MIVEGVNCASELLRAKYPIEKVIINKDSGEKFDNIISMCKANKVPFEMVDKKGIEKISKSGQDSHIVFESC